MVVLPSFLLLIMTLCQISARNVKDVTDGTELVLTFMTHRHGDRTPVQELMYMVEDVQAMEELVAPWGYGQLTDVGKRRAYDVGKFIRRRYDELLSEKFNRSEIYIRSTDSTRTKMTVLTAMTAVYPAIGDTWSEEINWVPIPYTTVPAKYDFNTAMVNCPNFKNKYYALMMAPSAKMNGFESVIEKLSEIINFDVTSMPALAYTIYDLFTSEISLGVDVGEEVNQIWAAIEAAAGQAIDVIFGDDDLIALQAGVLLNEFFEVAATVIAGNDTQRVRVYSAHDFNVYSLTAVSQITPRQGVPKYGAVFALELRKVVKTGEYVVLPVYVSSPEQPEIYLPVDGCSDLLCDINEFRQITSKYLLEETEWRTLCGWTEDYVVDTSSID